ncbi:hypothetical protein [Bradyrhizobium arachidis]|uniref:hypothetical protein n=1 Tax=Bradyrhizobium arachidis TaxID=858423 RepID=UPI0021620763|nr:hypothetical protein [Bradyrhizobium arachidis]
MPDPSMFRSGREFPASLAPKQNSTRREGSARPDNKTGRFLSQTLAYHRSM